MFGLNNFIFNYVKLKTKQIQQQIINMFTMTKYMRMRQLITKKFLQLSIHYTVIFLTLLYSQGEMKSMYKNSHTFLS